MPLVTIRTGHLAPDGREEVLVEYHCDWPDCPNIATQVVGCVRELGFSTVMCHEHASGRDASDTTRANRSESD